ncbi:MAG: C39 family peptidase [Planctomycetota bacterium]|nr:C39 family peptidase [Planctomycetota bacterium]
MRTAVEQLENRILLSVPDLQDVSSSGPEAPLSALLDAGSPAPLGAEGAGVTVVLNDVPEYLWYNGCAPTSTGMIMGYWDQIAYPSMFTGNASTQTAAVDDLIASPEQIRDYAPIPDPGTTHSNNCIADFLGTSRDPLKFGFSYRDSYPSGFENYVNWRGYDYSDTFNRNWGSVSFDDIKGEINAGRPFLISVDSDGDGDSDHAMAGMGYRTSPSNQFAARTTWNGMPGINWFDWTGMSVGDPFGIRGVTFFRPSANRPDLAPSYCNATPEPLTWGDDFTFSYTVENYGGQNAGASTIKFYLSSNDIITTSDTYLGSAAFAALNAYDGRSGSVTLSLPAAPPAGFTEVDTIYVGLIVDANDNVSEGAENNNAAGNAEARDSCMGVNVAYDPVTVSTKADLVGTQFKLDMSILNFGSTEASFKVANQGKTNAGSFQIKFYFSSNTFVSTGDTLLATRTISSLAAGATYSSTISLTVPTTAPVVGDNQYTVGMIIDAADAVPEDDEGNNSNEGYGLDKADVAYGIKFFNAHFGNGDGAMNIVNDTLLAPVNGLWHATTRGSIIPLLNRKMWYGVERTGDYDVGDSAGYFETKNISVPSGPSALSFSYLADVEASALADAIYVQVYDVVDETFTTVLSKGNGLVNDTSGKYVQATADLSQFAGKVIRVRWTFDTRGSLNNTGEGWLVDTIGLWGLSSGVGVEAYRSLRYDSNLLYTPSTLNYAGDHDTFVFNEEQVDGTFAIATDSAAAVRPGVAVYDYQTGEMLLIDSGAAAGSEASISLTNSDKWNTYLVEVWDVEENTTGNLDVTVNGTGVSLQTTMTANAAGHAERLGQIINDNTDTDFYKVTAPADASGDLEILVDPHTNSGLLPRLQVWKNLVSDAPDRVSYSNDGPTIATFTGVKPGDVFYICVADNDFALGAGSVAEKGKYDLTADFSTALPATLTSAGAEGFAYFHYNGNVNDSLNFDASIGSGTDVDSYIFAGDVDWDGNYVVTATAPAGSNVHPVIAVYNGVTGERLAVASSGGTATAQLTVNLPQAVDIEYVVAVADNTSTETGDVVLTIDAPGTGVLYPISVNAAGDGSRDDGNIGANDTDFYSFTAPADANGDLTVTVTPLPGIYTLDAAFALFDSTGKMLGQRYLAAAGVAEVLTVGGIVPAQTYYVSVMSRDHASAGLHSISVNFDLVVPDVYPLPSYDTWISPNQSGDIVRSSSISGVGDWTAYLIDSDLTDASATFTAERLSGGTVPVIGLYDVATGARLAWSSNPTNAATTSFTTATTRWTRYYLLVGSRGGAAGQVRATADFPTVATTTITTDAAGQGSKTATLNDPADIDYFAITAPATASGKVTITLTGLAAGLWGALAMHDSAGDFLTSANGAGVGSNVTLVYNSVVPGEKYYPHATSVLFANGSGAFTINVDFEVSVPPTINPADAKYDWQPNQFGNESLTGNLTALELSEIWAIRPEAAGTMHVTLSSLAFPAALGLYNSAGTLLAGETAVVAGGTAAVDVAGLADTTYYVYVTSRSGTASGGYTLTWDVPSFPTITSIPVNASGAGAVVETASPAAEQDFYQIVAPAGSTGVTVTMTPAATLGPTVRLYDTAGAMLDKANSVVHGTVVSFTQPVTAGQTYIIGAGGENLSTGAYAINVQFKGYPTVITGTAGNDVIHVRNSPGADDTIEVFVNIPTTDPPTVSIPRMAVPNLTFNTLAGADLLIVNFANGTPVPAGGIAYDGGVGSDSLSVVGSGVSTGEYRPDGATSGKGVVSVGSSNISFTGLEPVTISGFASFTFTTPNAIDSLVMDSPAAGTNRISGNSGGVAMESLTFSSVAVLTLDLATNDAGAGNDTFRSTLGNVAAGLSLLSINAGTGSNVARFDSGATNLDTNVGIGGVNFEVRASGNSLVNFGASQHLGQLTSDTKALVKLQAGGDKVIDTKILNITGDGTIDLFNNDMIVRKGDEVAIGKSIRSARNNGAWDGAGLTSTTARTTKYTGLAAIFNDNGSGSTVTPVFAGQAVGIKDVLVKYSWDGDANVDGIINADDYFLADSGYITQKGGYYNGDFNYDGIVNADDYFLIDSAYIGQSGPLSASKPEAVVSVDVVVQQKAKKAEPDGILSQLFSTEAVL